MVAHPTVGGLAFVTEESERGHTITLEPVGRAADAMFPVPFMLGIASSRFGVPSRDQFNDYIESFIESMPNDPNWVAPPVASSSQG